MECSSRIKNILNDVTGVAEKDTQHWNHLSDWQLDSIHFIKVVIQIEDQFDMEFDDECLDGISFDTIDSLATYVLSKVGK